MRKNKMMRAASGLLVATLLTTSVISGTFAKYTTSTTGTDKARVAYWGFNQDAKTEIDLFDSAYDSTGNATVKSQNGDNVVAPGTAKTTTFAFCYTNGKSSNTVTTADITAPEVDYTFTVDVQTSGATDKLDANPSFKWTLAKGDADATEYQTLEALTNAIKALSGEADGSVDYKAGKLPGAFTSANETYHIGWVWDFENGNDADAIAKQDAIDTAMGNADALDNVTLTITITATQVD